MRVEIEVDEPQSYDRPKQCVGCSTKLDFVVSHYERNDSYGGDRRTFRVAGGYWPRESQEWRSLTVAAIGAVVAEPLPSADVCPACAPRLIREVEEVICRMQGQR